VLDINALPDDVAGLKRLVVEHHAASQAKDVQLREQRQQIEHLKFQLAKLSRARFGRSSEQMDSGQLPLTLEELKAAVADAERAAQLETSKAAKGQPVRRKKLPEHFEHVDNIIAPAQCTCPDCGGELKDLGTPDEAEVLDVKTVTFTVTRHIRPKKRCPKCSCIVQAPAPSRPIERSFAGASLLALVLTWKYGFHLPLYRQCQIFAHAGRTLSRTTLMQWVGASSQLLGPLVAALAKYVLSAPNINADDTPIKVLAPGSGKTKRGHLWTYVRDGTAWGSTDPPAVWYQYSPSWHGKYPPHAGHQGVGRLSPLVKDPFSPAASFKHIQAFLDNSRGQITIGEIPPIRRATLAAEGKNARVALVCRDDETVPDLLQRLDASLGKALAENNVIDEVLPEKRRHGR
jgi:transposase